MPLISVFYSTAERGHIQTRSDFVERDKAEKFLESSLFVLGGHRFEFMLEDGRQLLKGTPMVKSLKYYRESMLYALDIPYSRYGLDL